MANRLQIEDKLDILNEHVKNISYVLGGETSKPTTASEIAIACRTGHIKGLLEVGEAVQFEVGGVKRNFLVMDFIENGQHSSGLKLTDGLQNGVIFQSELTLENMQLDAKEAFYSNDTEISANTTLNFTVTQQTWYAADVNKTFQFTVTQTIPANSKFVFNQAASVTMVGGTVTIYKSDFTSIETVTISEGSDGTALGNLSNAKNDRLNSCQRSFYGNNNWKESALRQHLNSDSDTTGFWTAQNIWDMPPSWNSSAKGFMSLLSDELKNNIAKVERHTYRNTVSDGGGYDTTYDKIWLPSKKEVYMTSETTSDDTEPFAFYKEGSQYSSANSSADPIRVKKNISGSTQYWWLESPYVGNASHVRLVYLAGAIDGNIASNTHGVAPAFVIA